MKKELYLSVLIISLGLIFSISNIALALSEDIKYPVKELGNCQNEKECRTYCDKPENMNACVAFSEENNLISGEEAKMAENFMSAKNKPGNCADKKGCETYCNDISNVDECVAFAEKNNLMPPKELEEAKKIQIALKQGAKMPGGCKNKDQCDAYCESANHMEECINFATENGMMQGKELEEAQKMLQAVKKGAKPPPCRNKKECDSYCSEENHFEECISFAEAAGFMSKEEAVMVRKTGGKGPGGCKGKEECDAFCQSGEENIKICAEFAFKNGMMTQKEFEMMKKTGGKGPGGCKGKEECDAFCDNPDNQETCFQFGRDNGMIPEEELKKMEQGKQQFQKSFENMPSEVADCISQKVGPEMFAKFKNGTMMPTRNTGEALRECFEKMGPPGEMGPPCEGNNCPPPGEMGPPCEGDNCPPPQNNQGMFNKARGFIKQMMPGNNQSGGQSAGTRVSITKESSGLYLIKINEPGGIKEFSFTSEGSNPYSGGLSGCPKDYSNSTTVIFPVKAAITDCKDEIHEFIIQGEGSAKSGGNDQEMQEGAQSEGINMTPGSAGPGGCKSPRECEEFCKNNQQECMNFRPAGEQRLCEGENCPPAGEAGQQQGGGIFNRAKNFMRKFAPGTEGGMPSGQPCKGENCPPPSEAGPLCEGDNCPPQGEFKCEGENCQSPAENNGFFDKARNYIKQFAPGTEGGMPSGPPCEGDNCPPPREMSPSDNNRQKMGPGENRTYMPPREGVKFEGDNRFRIPSPDEINQMQERMMREGEQRKTQIIPGTNGGFVPPTNIAPPTINPGEGFQPMQNFLGPLPTDSQTNSIPPTQFNQPTDFQRPPENFMPPSGSFQPPMDFQQAPPPTNTQPPTSAEPQPTSFKLALDKNLANAISNLLYKENKRSGFKELIQNKLTEQISSNLYSSAQQYKIKNAVELFGKDIKDNAVTLIAQKFYRKSPLKTVTVTIPEIK